VETTVETTAVSAISAPVPHAAKVFATGMISLEEVEAPCSASSMPSFRLRTIR
jgi:hypothetical protein